MTKRRCRWKFQFLFIQFPRAEYLQKVSSLYICPQLPFGFSFASKHTPKDREPKAERREEQNREIKKQKIKENNPCPAFNKIAVGGGGSCRLSYIVVA